jgi:hypothetical protein
VYTNGIVIPSILVLLFLPAGCGFV